MMLPAVLFPDPDRPSSTRRNSGADETAGKEEEVADEDGVEVEEEKTRGWEDEARDTCGEPSSALLNPRWPDKVKFRDEYLEPFLTLTEAPFIALSTRLARRWFHFRFL